MTCKRVTKDEKRQRHEWAMKQIDKGVGFSELASLVAETWGCSRRNARRVVSDAHKEWMDVAFGAEELDQRDILSGSGPPGLERSDPRDDRPTTRTAKSSKLAGGILPA